MILLLFSVATLGSIHGYTILPYPIAPISLLYPTLQQVTFPQKTIPLQQVSPFYPHLQHLTPLQTHFFPSLIQQKAVGVKSTFEDGTKFSPTRNATIEPLTPAVKLTGRTAVSNLDLCYFVGKDLYQSHVRCNQNR